MDLSPKNLIEFEKLGEGGFGEVHRGRYLGTPVAVKTLLKDDPESMRMFVREVQMLESLTHPHIVQIIAYDNRKIVMAMHSSSLKRVSNKEEMCLVARDCMRAITFMHSHDNSCVRHRDIKPDNILIQTDREGKIYKASLGDLGLATMCASKNDGGTKGFTPMIINGSDRMFDIFALAVSILDAVFDEKVRGAKGVYNSVEDYPRPGPSSKSENNTMFFAAQLLSPYYIVISKMLALVYLPGDTGAQKASIANSLLREWESLYDNLELTDDIKKSALSRFLKKFKK